MRAKDADGMAKSEDPDQIASIQEQFDEDLHSLLRPTCPNS